MLTSKSPLLPYRIIQPLTTTIAVQVSVYEAGQTPACQELQQKARKLTEKTLEACQYRRSAPGQVYSHSHIIPQVFTCPTFALTTPPPPPIPPSL